MNIIKGDRAGWRWDCMQPRRGYCNAGDFIPVCLHGHNDAGDCRAIVDLEDGAWWAASGLSSPKGRAHCMILVGLNHEEVVMDVEDGIK